MRWTNLGDLIDRNADLDRVAIIDTPAPGLERTFTHRDVDLLAGGIARLLLSRGLQRGASVAIAAFNRAEYLAAYFGIMRAGLVAVPINIKLPAETIRFVIEDSGAQLGFVDAAHRGLLQDIVPVIEFDDAGSDGFGSVVEPGSFESVVVEADEVGQLLYTSGSTGRPKGVPLSHHGQLWALSTRTSGALNQHERYIIAQPLYHMNGLFSAKTVFGTNASLVLQPSFDSRASLDAIAQHKVTAATAVPTMWARALKETDLLAARDFSSFRRLMLGSAPMTVSLLERIRAAFPGITISVGYGTTEAGPAIFGPHPNGLPAPPLALGTPINPDFVKLVGATENEGVLWMRNPAVTAGYRNLPAQTAKVLSDDGWYNSGDVMRRDAEGFYYFVGRADDMFVCAGENIYPGEVEKLLERHPAIQQAAVVPLPDEERSQVPVAFVVSRGEIALSAEDVKRFALAGGPAYQHPRRIRFLPELPWAGTNKIDRKALLDLARDIETTQAWDR
ncbi:class I adenylate-forming enzyme family protein [Rhodopseudomonas sp.]|uniref:class I adenylate-forming enzyme family protein n=1 Tax=Rhodopseudomonas sp. TaxID=1078 RepID=UPI003B3AF500